MSIEETSEIESAEPFVSATVPDWSREEVR